MGCAPHLAQLPLRERYDSCLCNCMGSWQASSGGLGCFRGRVVGRTAGIIRVAVRMPTSIVGEDGAALLCCASVTEVLCRSSFRSSVLTERTPAAWVGRRL